MVTPGGCPGHGVVCTRAAARGSLPVRGLLTTANPHARHGLMTGPPGEDGGWSVHIRDPRMRPAWPLHRVHGGDNVGPEAERRAGLGRPCTEGA